MRGGPSLRVVATEWIDGVVTWHRGVVIERYESPVEKQIREAQERGEFDDLPGSGKPLRDLGDPNDADWWIRGLIQRERLDMTGALPPGVALRKEAATFPEALADLSTEESVRAVLEDFNQRARRSRLQVVSGPHPPILAPTVDIEDMVLKWQELRRDAARQEHPARHHRSDEQRRSDTRPRRGPRWLRRRDRSR